MSKTIVICTFTFPPNKDGVSEAASAMAIGFAEKGHKVVVCTGHLNQRTDFQPHPGIHVEQFQIDTTASILKDFPSESRRYQQFLVGLNPDVLFCHCWETWPSSLAEAIFPQLHGKKVMVSHGYTTHLWQPHPKPPWGLGFLAKNLHKVFCLPWTIRKYDRVIFLSPRRNFNRFFDHWVARAISYEGTRVIPNGTPASPDRASSQEFKKKHDLVGKRIVLCVANYSVRKNQALAIKAFRKAAVPQSVLVFIGSEFNEYSTALVNLDNELKHKYPLGGVVFLENQDRQTTMAAFEACDLFLLTAKAETQPISILEAMAAGKPFLSTDTGCVRELPGGVVAAGEIQLARGIRGMCFNPASRKLLGDAGRAAVIQTFAMEKVWQQQNELLCELDSSVS